MARGPELFTTVVRNPTSSRKTYPFLPPHGRSLGPGEQLEFIGDLQNMFKQPGSKARLTALQLAISSGVLQILQTPSPIFYDETTGLTHTITINEGALQIEGGPTEFNESSLQSLGSLGDLD